MVGPPLRSVVRTAVRPALLGLLALMLVAAALFALLGHWQLDRARERAAPSPTERVVALSSVLAPAVPFTARADHQRVRASGTWMAGTTVLVAGRPRDGRAGSDVVTALRVRGASGTGALLPVVRGWLPAAAAGAGAGAAPAPAAGAVAVTGRLLVSEDPRGTSAGTVTAISSADLVNLWSGRLYTGYLVADAGAATGASASGPLLPVRAAAPVRRLDLQNLSYAFQWWLFAAFAVALWGKVVRDRTVADAEAAVEQAEREADQRADQDGSRTWEDGTQHPPSPPAVQQSAVQQEVRT